MSNSYDAVVTLTIQAPIETVWDGLTDPAIIAKYMMGARVTTDWVTGHPITWSGSIEGKDYVDKGEIVAVEPPHLLRMTHWSPLSDAEDVPENYHVVTYRLEAHGKATTLTLTQSNNPTQAAADEMAANGWTPMLQTLKSTLEG
jgi:uncharacterized protein YndB with AHSA1/START domain